MKRQAARVHREFWLTVAAALLCSWGIVGVQSLELWASESQGMDRAEQPGSDHACFAAVQSQAVMLSQAKPDSALNSKTTKLGTIPNECGRPEEFYTLAMEKLFGPRVRFSPNGHSVAYSVRAPKAGPPELPERHRNFCETFPWELECMDVWRYAVISGNHVGTVYERVSNLNYDSNGIRPRYVAEKGDNIILVLNGHEQQFSLPVTVTHMAPGPFVVSPDATRVAYVASNPNGRSVVLNGEVLGEYQTVMHLRFRSDGGLAYVGCKGINKGPCHLVSGTHTTEFPETSRISDYALDTKGRVAAYVQWSGSESRVVVQKKRGKRYRWIRDLRVSPNGTRLAYVADVDFSSSLMIVDGKESSRYASLQTPVFSPDSKHVAYIASEPDKTGFSLFLSGRRQGTAHPYATHPVFSPDGKHVAYVAFTAKTGAPKRFVVVDGVEQTRHDYIDRESLQFSPDGKFVMYGAGDGQDLWWTVESVQ